MASKAQTSNQIKLPYDAPRLKPGRHFCHCQARIHGLVRNCLSCGRVTCTQEGSGQCFNCGSLVCTREERQNRTKVTDMESDYYSLEHNSFLSSEDREAIIRRKEELKQLSSENRRKVVMDLDVTNKAITGHKHRSLETVEDPILQSILTNSKQNYVCSGVSDSNMEETLKSLKGFVPRYRSELSDAPALDASALKDARQLLERKGRNSVYCIALKEPLASLIAHGKRSHLLCQREIRHKGPVLIASLDENEFCSDYFEYPTTSDESGMCKAPRSKTPSILGKATLQDCMTWVEYNDEYTEGECTGVDDNFVLIFELQEAFTYPVPYSSPSEFYEIDRSLREVIARNMVDEGTFESLDLNSL